MAMKKAKTAVGKVARPALKKAAGALSNRDVSLMKMASKGKKMGGALSNRDVSLMKKKLPKYR